MDADSIYPEVIADRYELRELISRGGMSTVFRCVDKVINSDCAIKLLSLEEIVNRKGRERFEQECQMLLHFDHPNVIHNLDYGIDQDIPYLVMELCVDKQGRPFTLRQYQQQCEGGRVPWEDLEDIFAQFVRGLSLFHQHGLVHRDIKPENVLLHATKDDRLIPKLIDFGLVAVSCDADMGQRMQLSTPVEQQPLNSLQVNGTLKFMSPEQLEGQPVSASSDIYSMGVTLFNLMTGEDHPNVATGAWGETDAPDWLTELLFDCLQDEPEKRPQDATAMWEYFPEDVQEVAATQEGLDRDAPTKHQVKLSANTIILGDPIQGRFQVLEETGQHAGVSWFMCRDLSTGDMLSIRLIPYDRERDQANIDEFEHRCREIMKVEHPNLIKIIECGVDTMLGQTFLVTELIPDSEQGPLTLNDLVQSKADGRLSWREVGHFAPQISSALAALHRNGLSHGQLSPRNTLIATREDGTPQVKLMGFADCEIYDASFTRYLPQFSGRESAFGRPGEEAGIIGDYDFMSPEQRHGAAYDPQTDAYAFGRIVYYMATGYERVSVSKPTEINPELPGWVDDVCEHCLEEDRSRRIESVLLAEHLIPEDIRAEGRSPLVDDGERTETDVEIPVLERGVGEPKKAKKALIINELPKQRLEKADSQSELDTRMDSDSHPPMDEHVASRVKPEIAAGQEEVASTLSISLKSAPEEETVKETPPPKAKTLGITRLPPPMAGAFPEETIDEEPPPVAVEEEPAPAPRKVELRKVTEAPRLVKIPQASTHTEEEPATQPTLRVIENPTALVPISRPAEPILLQGRRRRRSWINRWRRRHRRFTPALIIVGGVFVSFLVCLFCYAAYKTWSGDSASASHEFFVNYKKAEKHLERENYPAALRCAEDAQKYASGQNADEQRRALDLLKRIRDGQKASRQPVSPKDDGEHRGQKSATPETGPFPDDLTPPETNERSVEKGAFDG